jgi:hypothetical protein
LPRTAIGNPMVIACSTVGHNRCLPQCSRINDSQFICMLLLPRQRLIRLQSVSRLGFCWTGLDGGGCGRSGSNQK